MAHQYGPRGLRVAIVDASVLTPGSQPSHDAVLNASYDWQLNFPLLLDRNGQLARQLGVKEVPTTFLIAIDGTIAQRWQGRTRPAILAQGIERLLGGPLGQVP
jgi:peroxiredoxin